jgi:hypothetical protein
MLLIEAKYYKGELYIIIRRRYYSIYYPTSLNYLEAKCPNILKDVVFFNKIEFWRYYYNRLLKDKDFNEIERTMTGCLSIYDPLMYNIFGRYNLEIGDLEKAKKYIFLSGIYNEETEQLADSFLKQFIRGPRNQILGRIPDPFKSKNARNKIPSLLKGKLRQINAPDWLTR